MKGIKGIVIRNVLSAAGIAIIILITNIFLLIGLILLNYNDSRSEGYISSLSGEFYYEDNKVKMTDSGEENLTHNFQWGMLLDDEGNVIWSINLPDDVPLKYSISDVAGFTKWYLNDYPVNVWTNDYGLLVLGSEKNSIWKHEMFFSMDFMSNLSGYFIMILVINFSVAIFLAFISGLKFFKSLKKVASGVSDIADKKPVHLSIKGSFKSLADDINKTSEEVIRQQKIIDKRDNARNNWIIGVSHDIRTPLSMIMGYSSTMENNMNLDEDSRKQAAIIRNQSEKIKELVNDLNLTLKLEYEMQPLDLKPVYICQVIRKVCVDYLNNMCDDRYFIDLDIDENVGDYKINGDIRLIERVFNNLIGNSINHNEDGCNILIKVRKEDDRLNIEICDDGSGFSMEKLEELNNSNEIPTGKNHGIGLFIVKQIIEVHKGNILFANGQKGCKINIQF